MPNKPKLQRVREAREAAEAELKRRRREEVELVTEQRLAEDAEYIKLSDQEAKIRNKLHRLRVTLRRKEHGIDVRTKQIKAIRAAIQELDSDEQNLVADQKAIAAKQAKRAEKVRAAAAKDQA